MKKLSVALSLTVGLWGTVASAEERMDTVHCNTTVSPDLKRKERKEAKKDFHSYSMKIDQRVGDYIKPKNGLDASGAPFKMELTAGAWVSMYDKKFTSSGHSSSRGVATIRFASKSGTQASLTYKTGPFEGLSMSKNFNGTLVIGQTTYSVTCTTTN